MNSPESTHNDEYIAKEVCDGNKEKYGTLIDRYEQKLSRYVKRFTRNEDDVEDLVQTIFVKGYVHLNSFDQSRSFNSWIYRIAHNECVNYLKKRGGEKVSFMDFDVFLPHPFAKETADDRALFREKKESIEQSLEKISPKYREILILYYFEDMEYQEISDVLEIPTSTVGVRLKRAKEAIKKYLQHHYDQD